MHAPSVTAAKVAAHKAKHPEQYCPTPRCLWKTGGRYCPRHKPIDWNPVVPPKAAHRVRLPGDVLYHIFNLHTKENQHVHEKRTAEQKATEGR